MTSRTTENFVPLTSAPTVGEQRDFQVKVLARDAQPKAFQTIEARGASAASSTQAPTHNGANCEPRISVQREGDKVTSIRVQCSCGQVIDLACVY